MQIFINGQEIDLYQGEKVAITLQINNLGELDKSNTSYTNSFKIPRTATNTRIFENLGIPGNTSRVMFNLNNVSIYEDSLPILVNGFGEITETTPTYYTLNVYGSEKSFFEKIKNVTVKDCFPDFNLSYTSSILANYIRAVGVFCFPLAQYNGNTIFTNSLTVAGASWTRTHVEQTTPVFYAKYLFDQIFVHLGYTVEYPMGAEFINMVVPAQKGVSHFGLVYGQNFNIKNCVTEINAGQYIKEIMWRFGLIIQVDEVNKKVSFTKMDTLLSSGQILDWTDKLVEIKNEKYKLDGYAQKNIMTYAEDEADDRFPLDVFEDELEGSFNLDIQTYDAEKEVITSEAIKPKMWGYQETNEWAKGFIWFWNYSPPNRQIFMLDIAENSIKDDGTVELKEVPFQFMMLRGGVPPMNFTFLSPNGQNDYTAVLTTPRVLTKNNLSWQYYIDNYYKNIYQLLAEPTTVKVIMHLSVLDIYNLNFFNRIYLEQYGSYFYLSKINNWQKDKLVEVELIKIPPISTASGYYASSARMIGTL